MRPFLLSLLLHSVVTEAYPVFTFNGTSSRKEPSFAYLVKDVDLPERFSLCSSVKQARFDDVGFYTIDGEDSVEWLSMEFRTYSMDTKLIVGRGKNIHKFGKLFNPRLDYWYHICLGVDLKENEIKLAMNGDLLGNASIDVSNVPSKLNMKIGVGHRHKLDNNQFQGSVANIQLFDGDSDLTALSSSPCQTWPSTLLPWIPNNWRIAGSDWMLTEDFDDIFCNIQDSYHLAIQSRLSIHESMDICKHKLNNSILSFETNENLFQKFIAWHVNVTGGACFDIWTPFSDEQSEGVFINMNDNVTTELDLWGETEPNGGRDENMVVINIPRLALVDKSEKSLSCSSCLLSSSLLLRLDGLCKDSLIGIFM